MFASRSAKRCFASAVLVAAVCAAVAAAAIAEEPRVFSMATPAQWDQDIDLASNLAKLLGQTVHLGELEKTGGAAAYVKPGTGGLYISWLQATEKSDAPEPIIRKSLDELRGAVDEAGLEAGQVEELEYSEHRKGNVIEARMAWRQKENETITVSRTFVWRNKQGLLRLLRGECLFAEAKRDPVAEICRSALSTLTSSEIEKGDVGELGEVAQPADDSAAEPAAVDAGAAGGSGSSEADLRKPLYQDSDSKKSNRSNLWIFLVGAALIAFAFYAGTRTGRGASPERPAPPPPAPPSGEEEAQVVEPEDKEEEE